MMKVKITKHHNELAQQIRKVVWSCTTPDHLRVAWKLVLQFGRLMKAELGYHSHEYNKTVFACMHKRLTMIGENK